jgi:CubicO group peptidase (beta-lactamase class C family)
MANINSLPARLTLAITIGVASSSINGAALGADSASEQHIQHLLNAFPTQSVRVVGEAEPTITLEARMAALKVPGVSLAYIHDGKIAWARGVGVAKLGGPAVTPQTLFQAGSISKPVATMAVLRLVQSGKLDLDADVNRYLKSWKVPESSFTQTQKVTLRRLLTHTAGITVHGFPGYAADAAVPALVQVLSGERPANSPPILVDTIPGTAWRYSGGGFVITQQLLHDVTDKPFSDLMQDTVLRPVGMIHSTYQQPLPQSQLADAATPYERNGIPVAGGAHTYPEASAAGLWTTPSDLAQYAIEVQNALAGKSRTILSQSMARQMVKDGGLGHWGLGLEVGGGPDHPYFTHGGSDAGFQSELVAFDQGDGLVIMTNGDGGSQLATEIQRAVAEEYNWPEFQPKAHTLIPVTPEVLDRYVGRYQFNPEAIDTVTRRGDHLYMQISGQPEYELFPEGPGTFFVKFTEAKFSFSMGPNGRASGQVLQTAAETISMARLPDTAKL